MPYFYSLTLEPQGAILGAIQGSYSAARAHEVVVNRGRSLELLQVDTSTGRIGSVCRMEVFSLIRCIANFRLIGSSRDFIVATSDSGNIVLLEYKKESKLFVQLHSEPYGKSGCRRIVPGQYLGVDPGGRSIMISAIERQKFVYTLNFDNKDTKSINISSPIEVHKSNMICFSLVAVDVGYDNPMFATIEQAYDTQIDDCTQRQLIFWEVDLGLNHVIRKNAFNISLTSHLVLSVPGGSEGPGGVLVCDQKGLYYYNIDHTVLFCSYPQRFGAPNDAGTVIVSSALHKLRKFFFILIQSECGDIYRVQFMHNEGIVNKIKIYYYDTIPLCNSMLVLRSGFLFAAHEFGNHSNYQFLTLGDDENDSYSSSISVLAGNTINSYEKVFFRPRNCHCIRKVDIMHSLSPIIDMKVADSSGEFGPQIYVACGRGPRSTLRICTYGKAVEEMAETPLPGRPRFIWTLKKGGTSYILNKETSETLEDEGNYHSFIIISFIDRTLVLSVGEQVEEISDSPFTLSESTIYASSMELKNSYLQILETYVKLITEEKIYEWKAPDGRHIVAADSNGRQISLALSGGYIVILEMNTIDLISGTTNSAMGLTELCRREVSYDIICISIQQLIYPTKLCREYVAVGTSTDNSVRVYWINTADKKLKQTSTQVMPNASSIPENIVLYKPGLNDSLYLLIGLNNGVLLCCIVDELNGTLSDNRSRFLGGKSIKMVRVGIGEYNKLSTFCMANRPWIVNHNGRNLNYIPIQYRALDTVAPFHTKQFKNGFVAVSGTTLVIFQVLYDDSGTFTHSIIKLNYTPRKLLFLPPPQLFCGLETLMVSGILDIPKSQMIAIIETDHNAFDYNTKKEIIEALQKMYDDDNQSLEEIGTKNEVLTEVKHELSSHSTINTADEGVMDVDDTTNSAKQEDSTDKILGIPGSDNALLPESEVGSFLAGDGIWGSCIRVVNSTTKTTEQLLYLDVNEGCISACVCKFDEMDLPCLVVGTTYGMKLRKEYNENSSTLGATIKVYNYDTNFNLKLVHVTPIENVATCMVGWRGRLLVSINKTLRIYSLGKKKLLKKCEYRSIPEVLVWLKVINDRIFAGDIRHGVIIFKYHSVQNRLSIIANDIMPRWLTSACEILDYHTVITSDKFDNLIVCRVPTEASSNYDFTSNFNSQTNTSSYMKPYQINPVAHFHVGDLVTCIHKNQLSPLGVETLIFGTILGSIGTLTPITNKDDVDLLCKLELLLRNESPSLMSRDHLMFRSYYAPVLNVIDGDLCETFTSYGSDVQARIASSLDISIQEIFKKLDDLRTRIL
ncbi:spliceosomal protein SAP 130 [Cryptosporidium andersoni]|uniref:Spliceosomal protein SAP 130 n=1 Tax=Cryptosporidium andersoni TaxID=117008 RepID=A0A1J4MYC8_9CRYT|nr:spliceosomal protein SAP 130 [Cryptosporidium andersoni]